jgi:thioredoxin 1
MASLPSVTDAGFEADVLQSKILVLVDFWAEWCGPCKMLGPVLESIVDDYADQLRIVKLNVDENPETPPKFGVRGIPTLILFKDGEVLDTKVGALNKSQLNAFLQTHLSKTHEDEAE